MITSTHNANTILKINISLDSLIGRAIIGCNTSVNAVKDRTIPSGDKPTTEHGRKVVHGVLFIGSRANLHNTERDGVDGLE